MTPHVRAHGAHRASPGHESADDPARCAYLRGDLDRLVDALADAPRIKRVHRSDRDVIAIHGRCGGTSLHELLTETWHRLGPTPPVQRG